ncbi:MAG: ABC transporter ATP-binding protein [Flavisolibacter sp.]
MNDLLTISNLSIDFQNEGELTHAVKNVSLKVKRGEVAAIVGESGSGKSVTSLSILKLLPKPTANYPSGSILFSENGNEAIDILNADSKTIQEIRGNKIAMIFQEPMTSLNPVMKCGDQITEVLVRHKGINYTTAKQQAIDWLARVKLPEPGKMMDRYPHQLSGGQKQRVMIAIAMCCVPSLLICDEPTTALDVTVQKSILSLLLELKEQHHIGIIFITHDLGVVSEIADHVSIMYRGEIVEQNITSSIFNDPQHPYTKALIACRPGKYPKGYRLPTVENFLGKENYIPPSDTITDKGLRSRFLISVQNISVRFPGKKNILGKTKSYVTAVDSVSFEIFENETLGLVGESGCGKTTLGRTLLKLIEPYEGKIIYNNEDITHISEKKISELRKEVQLIFQDPYSSLNPRLTIGDAIAEPMKVAGLLSNNKQKTKRVEELLDKVKIASSMMHRYPHQFSGGQRQRIVIARALALAPSVLVCDESVSALDVSVQAQVLNLLNDLKKDLNLTMVFISHDLSVVRYMCDRILVMNKGKIVEQGKADDIYLHPSNEYTKTLLSSVPTL